MSELAGSLAGQQPRVPWENRQGHTVGRPRRSQELVQSQPLAEKGLSQGRGGAWVAVAAAWEAAADV